MNTHVFHITTPVQLNISQTIVHLEDYILDCDTISSLSAPDGITVWENKKENLVMLNISDNSVIHAVDVLHVDFTDGDSIDIPLFKSKKILYSYSVFLDGFHNSVQIAGDFNSWNPNGYSLQVENGVWTIELEIEPGNYAYQLIVDGNWITDPHNNNTIDNGYGGYNSLLNIPVPDNSKHLHATPISCIDTNIIIHIEGDVSNTLVLWQNSVLPQNQTLLYGNRLMITIPIEAKKEKRSFIRCYCYSENSMAQDILIPLENGKVVQNTKQLTRNDKEAQIIYFILLDRFYNGNTKNDRPISDSEIHAKLNFHGGDIAGVTQKIKDGYIPLLGVNTLWISPIVKNPDGFVEKNNHKFTAYHGYWPVDSEKIDDRFGTEHEMHEMVSEAHTRNISIILDYVANHVHKDNPIYAEHHERATNLLLPDGSMNIGRWEEHRYTTWFDDFLPTLDFDIPEVLEMMTDIAVSWIKKYNLDGFRHDATKHISTKFWRTLTKKLKHEVMIKESRRLFQIGETFGGRDMLQSYINSGIQDGQFSFNVYYELRNTFLYEEVPFSSLTTAILQDIQSFGAHNLMGNITGNHDMPRFISYAGEDLAMNQNAELEGWNRHITVKNPVGYKKLQLLTVCVATIPGIPVIYYGDEIGMAGGGDPDNRRPMRFEKLNKHELENLSVTRKILQFRNHSLALIYGDFLIIHEDAQQLVYSRTYFCSTAIIILNKASVEATVSCKLPNILCKHEFSQLEDIAFSLSSQNLTITMPPYSYQILYTQKDCSEPSAFHNSDKSFFNFR